MSKEIEKKYIFPQIVEGKTDIIGMIAYSFYKIEKVDFIKNSENAFGKSLDQENLNKFQESKLNEISGYRENAKKTLTEVIEMTLKDKNKEIYELEDRLKKEKEDIDKKNKDFVSREKKLTEKERILKVQEKELSKKEKMLKAQEKELEKRNQTCKVQKSSFWYGVSQSLVATIFWTILVILIIKATEYDIIKFFTENQ